MVQSSIIFENRKSSDFSSAVSEKLHKRVKDEIENHLFRFLDEYADRENKILRRSEYQSPPWEIIQIGVCFFRVGIFYYPKTSVIDINIQDYTTEFSNQLPVRQKINSPGKIKGVRVSITSKLKIDSRNLCSKISKVIDQCYKCAAVDYITALNQYSQFCHYEELHDVLRKSSIGGSNLLKDITLYSVYKFNGRHIPCYQKIQEIIPRISKGIPHPDIDPLKLSLDYYLTSLNGKRFELYTQKAFKEKKSIFVDGTKYTGDSDVRLATESFFKFSPVNVHPITIASDEELLISAIYPAHHNEQISSVIEEEKENFETALLKSQNKSRNGLEKLEKLIPNSKKSIDDWLLLGSGMAGEFLKYYCG